MCINRKRQSRYTVPSLLVDRFNNLKQDDENNHNSTQKHQEEVVNLLIISGQIRALCQKDAGRTRSSKNLHKRMVQIGVCVSVLFPL